MSLKVENLQIAYRTQIGDITAVDGISFLTGDGEIMGLAGESGCGKSTLGNSLIYLDPRMKQQAGRVELDGKELPIADSDAMRPRRMKDISLIPQYAKSALSPTRKISKIIAELLHCHSVPYTEVRGELERRIALVGLDEDVLDRYPFELSGGMRQRVTLVMSTLLNPSLLIADEITSALDGPAQRAVGEMMVDFRSWGFVKSMIVISRDLSILAQIADSIVVMYAGRLAEKAGTGTIIRVPLHPCTKMLLASPPEAGVRYEDTVLPGIPGRPPPMSNPPPGCRFRDRCPFAATRCEQPPPFEEIQPGHFVACWKAVEEAAG